MLLFGEKEFFPTVVFSEVGACVCNINFFTAICAAIMGSMGGYSPDQLNKSRLDVYVKLNLAGTSVKVLIHYNQVGRSGILQAYDWGSPSLNMQHYNQTTPPVYNVEDMKVPTAMFTGLKDFLSDPEDVEILKPKIHNLTYLKTIPDFSHFDFILGLNARKEVSEEILTILRKYEGDVQL